jgi:hypothetical protein
MHIPTGGCQLTHRQLKTTISEATATSYPSPAIHFDILELRSRPTLRRALNLYRYGLNRHAMENPSSDSDNHSFRGHLLGFQESTTAAGGSVIYNPMILGIEDTKRTDEIGKWFFLCTEETYARVVAWIDKKLPDLYDKTTDKNTTEETAFPAPSRGTFSKHADIMATYTSDLRASPSTSKSTTDSQNDPALTGGGYTYTRSNRPTKPRKTKETKLNHDSSEHLNPPFRPSGTRAHQPKLQVTTTHIAHILLPPFHVSAAHLTTTQAGKFTKPVENPTSPRMTSTASADNSKKAAHKSPHSFPQSSIKPTRSKRCKNSTTRHKQQSTN